MTKRGDRNHISSRTTLLCVVVVVDVFTGTTRYTMLPVRFISKTVCSHDQFERNARAYDRRGTQLIIVLFVFRDKSALPHTSAVDISGGMTGGGIIPSTPTAPRPQPSFQPFQSSYDGTGTRTALRRRGHRRRRRHSVTAVPHGNYRKRQPRYVMCIVMT